MEPVSKLGLELSLGQSCSLAGPGHFYAFDRTTGAPNQFLSGGISGGGGTTVAFDAARSEFYVLEDVGGPTINVLRAFSYSGNNSISQLWQKTGAGIGLGGSVAIGADGGVYSAAFGVLTERDPVNGNVIRTIPGLDVANGIAPALSASSVVVYSNNTTQFYDVNTLALLRTVPGSRGSANSPYDGPGAFFDSGFVVDYGNFYGRPGFDVYFVPEPTTSSLSLIGVLTVSISALSSMVRGRE